MAELENGSHDETVAHLERELESNALEEWVTYRFRLQFLQGKGSYGQRL